MKLRLQDVLASDELPSIPEVAHRVLRLAQDRTIDVDVLAEAVKADPAMAAKILRTANSAFFGRQYKVTSLHAAIPVLGGTLIRTLVLGFSLTRQQTWQALEETYRKVWQRALWQAVTAETLARRLPSADPESYFLAGLIQDVGVLALLRARPQEYAEQILRNCSLVDLAHTERKVLGFSHVDVSVALGEEWSLAPETIHAIADHHGEVTWLRRDAEKHPLAVTLKLASLCAHHLETQPAVPRRELTVPLRKLFGLRREELPEFFTSIDERMQEASQVFGAEGEEVPGPHELLGQARQVMEGIAIQSQLDAAAAKQDAMKVRDRLETVESRSKYFEQEMFKDPLTGAHNRRLLETGLETEIAICIEGEKPLGMLFLDIDRFKKLNDVLGHQAGDAALKSVVEVLKRFLREDDLVIRYGGDEFIAILIGVSALTLQRVAARICREIEEALKELHEEVSASASLGGIHCPCEYLHEFGVPVLIEELDRRMYQAKQQGGNQVEIVSLSKTGIIQLSSDDETSGPADALSPS